MSITAIHKASVYDSANGSSYVTGSWTPTANRIAIASVENSKSTTPGTVTLSGNGLTWTQVATYVCDTVDPMFRITVFVALTGASPSAGAVTATISVSGVGGSIIVDEIDGAYISGTDLDAIVQSKTGSVDTSGSSESITLNSGITSGNASYGTFLHQTNTQAITPGTGYSALGEGSHTGPATRFGTIYKSAGAQTVDASWTTSTVKGGIALEIKAASGGTAYTQSVSGGITPTGALSKQTNKILSGAITSIIGTIIKMGDKLFAGSITPAGTVNKQTNKILSGAVSTIEGALATVKTFLISLSGGITPSGTVTKQTGKSLSGSNTPTGTVSRLINKFFTGSLVPVGTVLKQVSKSFSGAISSIAGTLAKQTNKSLSGGATPSGTVAKQTNKNLTGGMTPAGTINKTISKFLSGAISSITGALSSLFTPAGSGPVVGDGDLVQAAKRESVQPPKRNSIKSGKRENI